MLSKVHKFAQKFGFKGPWDATGKIIKGTIMRNELKKDRCSNGLECYLKLKRDLMDNGSDEKAKNWLRWEREGVINGSPPLAECMG